MKNVTYISAGAGSGKTHNLTTTLAELIAKDKTDSEHVEPEQVFLTTFTVKAANEFKEKAKIELYKLGKYDEASRLDNALIGTIDSVAISLLQKYWYTIGLSPKQGVMDDNAKATYINQSIANIPTDEDLHFFAKFRKVFNVTDSNAHPDENFWKSHLKDIVEKSISFDITDYSASVEESLDILRTLCDETHIHIDNGRRVAVLEALFIEVGRCRESAKKKKTLDAIETLQNHSQYMDDIEWYAEFAKILGGAPALPKNAVPIPILEDAKENAINMWRSQEVYDLQEKYIQTIFRLAKEWNEQYTLYKLNKRIVDFSDIEHYMYKLLQDKNVAEEIGRTYTHLFVDEFQDCSPIQVKIFMALADVVKKSYWVGDTKQAIYGFRGSDTLLTKAVADAIAAKKGLDGCELKTLNESWRSVPKLVEACNKAFVKIFHPVFGEDTEKLVPLEPAMVNHRENFDIKLEERAKHPLRYLKIEKNGNTRSQKLGVDGVAMYIKNIIEEEGVKPSDIAVLGRTGFDLDAVQDVLERRLHILCDRETVLNKDESKACQLMMALTTLTINPQDDLAKAEIAYLTQDTMSVGAIIDSKLEYNNTPKEERKPWLGDTEMIKRVDALRPSVMYQGIGALMETLAVELDVKNVMERWGTPIEKSMADVKTLIAVAKQYEDRSSELAQPATPSGFKAFLDETEIKLPITGNGVHLLTFHGAKGLEWKYVFLLMDETLEPKSVLRREFYGIHHYHPETPSAANLYPEMNIRLLPWIFGSLKNVPESISQLLLASEKFKRLEKNCKEESARLLYVGMTRAVEVLVLVPWFANKEFDWFIRSGLQEAGQDENGDVLGIGEKFEVVQAKNLEEEIVEQNQEPTVCHRLDYYSKHPSEAESLTLSPSALKGKANDVKIVYQSEQFIKIASGKLHGRRYSEVGDCIHNVYAVIEHLNRAEVEQLLHSHGMGDVLPNTDDVIRAWDNLLGFLNREYGAPLSIYHERPFRQLLDNGSLVVGSIDFVYQTPKGSILIDFKTFPQVDAVTDPTSEHYAGCYAGQLDAYTDALEATGEKVIKRFIYYPVSGLLCEISRAFRVPDIVMNTNVYCFDASDNFDINKMIENAAIVLDAAIICVEMDPDEKEIQRTTMYIKGGSTQGIETILLQTGVFTINLPYLASRKDVALAFTLMREAKKLRPELVIYDSDENTMVDLSEENEVDTFYYRLDNMARIIEDQNYHIGVKGLMHEFHIFPEYIKAQMSDAKPQDWTYKAFDDFIDIQWNYENYENYSRAQITTPDGEEFVARLLYNNKGFAGVCQKVILFNGKEHKMVPIDDFFAATKDNKYIKRLDYAQFVVDEMPEDEWKAFFDSFDVEPIGYPKTYLLRWNPVISSFKIDEYRRATIECPDGFCFNWSVYEWEEAHKGDFYYMLRTGDDKAGIVFRGVFTSEPYQGEDWAGTEKQRYYMDMDCYDCVPADEQPPISVDVLEKAIPDIDWRRGHSGQLLSEEVAMKLDELWNGMMSKE